MGGNNLLDYCEKCGCHEDRCKCDDRPNTYVAQEGGDHYQAEYQHWDWVVEAEIGYLAGNATKYVSRWWKKNGVGDLKKALTYIDKMIATRPNSGWHYSPRHWDKTNLTQKFIESAKLDERESAIILLLSGSCSLEALRAARAMVNALIESPQRAASTGQRVAGAAAPPQAAPPAQQALRGAPTTADATRHHGATGMEHPFGYDASQEQVSVDVRQRDLAIRSFGLCPCGCNKPRRKGMQTASNNCFTGGNT